VGDELRRPLFFLAVLLLVLALLVELGSGLLVGGGSANAELRAQATELEVDVGSGTSSEPPGRAIGYLAFVDILLLLTMVFIALSVFLSNRITGRAQGIVTLIVSFFVLIAAFIGLIIAFVELLIMVSLFLAVPFGTIAYLAIWGSFPRGEAAVLLSLVLLLKIGFAIFLLLSQQQFHRLKLLVAMILTTLLLTVVVSFLHGFPPRILASITDDIAAIVIAIVAIVWAIIVLIGSIIAVVKAIRTVTAVE
jgi:hypothetical protein